MLFNVYQKYHNIYKLSLIVLLGVLGIYLLNSPAQAQHDYRNLILSSQYNKHYLSPYITRYTQTNKINNVYDIVSTPSLQSELLSHSGSIILFDISQSVSWLTFDAINRSEKEEWLIDFGTSFHGRFGIFDSVTAYSVNKTTNEIKSYPLKGNIPINIQLPLGEETQVILRFEKTDGLPASTPLHLFNGVEGYSQNINNLFFISIIFLIGMAFFFAAVAIVKFNYNYVFFSIYYLSLTLLLYVQNKYVSINWNFIHSEFFPYLIFAVTTIALAIANLVLNTGHKQFWMKKSFFLPVLFGLISAGMSHLIVDQSNLLNFFLLFGPSILIILSIPLFCIIQGPSANGNSAPFMLGWFVLLFGISISILALSGILQPVSSAINAYWFALIPQAILFVFAARIDVGTDYENIILSKTLEINESETTTKLRKSKENTEQERLLKVIEQERKILNELRKSEARQTDAMRKAKELADEANKGKSAFLAVVSHEIRTPMTGIMGMVRMLLNSNLTKEQHEYAQTIQDSSDAMLALLNDILDFEKIEQGKMTFEQIDFDLPRLIQGVTTLMQGHAAQKGITLNIKLGESLPHFVIGDPTRLRQVLLNLTGNAIKFTENGGVIVTAEMMKQDNSSNICEVYFSVTDNGIGISEKAKKDLFAPFSQADKTISRKFGGTGLGLAISNGLISGMGSEINVSSIEEEGSTFFFTLSMPLGKDDIEHKPKAVKITTNAKDQKKILLVDDNHINRQVVHGLLSDLPYKIHDEENAEDGIKELNTQNFDLVLMDIELPGMNGDEATKKIRESNNPLTKNIPIIAITGNTQDKHIDRYYNAGVNSFVAKPIDPTALITTIQNVTNGVFGRDKAIQSNPHNIKPSTPPPSSETKVPAPTTDLNQTIQIKKSPKKLTSNPSPIEKTISMASPPIKKEAQSAPKILSHTGRNNTISAEVLDDLKKHLTTENINEMVSEVLDKTDEIIKTLQAAVQNQNQEIVKGQCHDLKGMAGNFGLQEISDIAKDIELKLNTQPFLIISTLINKLPDAKKRAETALSEWSSKNM